MDTWIEEGVKFHPFYPHPGCATLSSGLISNECFGAAHIPLFMLSELDLPCYGLVVSCLGWASSTGHVADPEPPPGVRDLCWIAGCVPDVLCG